MAKYGAYGAILKRGATTMAGVTNITGPNLSLETIDVTAHDSPGAMREAIASLIDPGDVTVELIFDPDAATHIAMRTDLTSRTATAYSITFVDATPTVASFQAFVTAFGVNLPVDGAMTASLTLKITGTVTFA